MRWTDEELAKLSGAELKTLLENVTGRKSNARFSLSQAEDIEGRIRSRLASTKSKSRSGRRLMPLSLEQRVAGELGQVAERLNAKFDLSPETAKHLSVGTKAFKAHSLTDKKGNAKTGGSMKGGRMAIDRYISYRVKDSLISLAFLLLPGQSDDQGRFVLLATNDLLTEGEPLDAVVPTASEYGWSPAFRARMLALPFSNVDEAAVRYEALIERLAPGR